jgi:hypothetical protein
MLAAAVQRGTLVCTHDAHTMHTRCCSSQRQVCVGSRRCCRGSPGVNNRFDRLLLLHAPALVGDVDAPGHLAIRDDDKDVVLAAAVGDDSRRVPDSWREARWAGQLDVGHQLAVTPQHVFEPIEGNVAVLEGEGAVVLGDDCTDTVWLAARRRRDR